ncbi:MAG: AMIN domain-containing protein [Desulfomonile sp.]|nr:AMIN domain-containing protein [Desulfomonile sp.]
MRSPVRISGYLCLAGLLAAIFWSSATAAPPGKITGVSLDSGGKQIFISCQGSVGRHQARVIGQPNRIVVDFDGMDVAGVPPSVKAAGGAVQEVRVGKFQGRARVVADFGGQPVPAFKVVRDNDRVAILLGNSTAGDLPAADREGSIKSAGTGEASPLAPKAVPAAGPVEKEGFAGPARQGDKKSLDVKEMKLVRGLELNMPSASLKAGAERSARSPEPPNAPAAPQPEAVDKPAQASTPGDQIKVAQRADITRSPGSEPAPGSRSVTESFPRSSQGASSGGPSGSSGARMVREARPPVTPPTPDPRLLVQEITELTFTQVGHNARLIVRGGDHLDYRLNKVSPTKVRVDLINAEIPKAHQKPLRTDLFSTSVEMIVPGSQTIFIQLKDSVPYQVQKQKGVLMIDFPPPRFAMTQDQMAILAAPGTDQARGREAQDKRREDLLQRREATRIMREEEFRSKSETVTKQINVLLKEQEEVLKERREIERKFRITPDPEVFSKPVTMDFQGISLRNAFRLLAEQAGINIIVGNEVAGSTTMRLFQVPLGQVIDHLLKTHNLDRELVGNVMWVGSRDKIAASKAERLAEHRRLLKQVEDKIARNKKAIQDLEAEREKTLQELSKKEEEEKELPAETPTFETVGATETVTIDGQAVTLLLVRVKLVYTKVDQIQTVLNCVFNKRCGPAGPTPAEAAQQALASRQEQLTAEGFQPGSPGAQHRLQLDQEMIDRERRTRAAELVSRPTGPGEGAGLLESGMDERMRKILAHTVLWANTQYNMLFIKDLPERIEEMKKLIRTLDIPTPQVLVESRLVVADRDWARGLGIRWGGRQGQSGDYHPLRSGIWGIDGINGAANSPTGGGGIGGFTAPLGTLLPSQYAVNLPVTVANGVLSGLGVQFGLVGNEYITDLDMQIMLGETTGDAKVIARPKTQVIDGKKASIKIGTDIPYVTVSAAGTQTQLVSADLKLDVTPKIYYDGRIEMLLKITDNEPGDIINGLTSIRRREAESIMIVKDGDTAVIGGILRRTKNMRRQGIPGVMNVPVLNILFSNKRVDDRVEELLIFVTPTLIKKPPPAA